MKAEALGFAVYCAQCVDRPEASLDRKHAVEVAIEAGYRDVRNKTGKRITLCPSCLDAHAKETT